MSDNAVRSVRAVLLQAFNTETTKACPGGSLPQAKAGGRGTTEQHGAVQTTNRRRPSFNSRA
jgi:hypothetical protein